MYGQQSASHVMIKRKIAAEDMADMPPADLEAFVREYYAKHKDSTVSRLAPYNRVDSKFYKFLGAVDLIRKRAEEKAVSDFMDKYNPRNSFVPEKETSTWDDVKYLYACLRPKTFIRKRAGNNAVRRLLEEV